MGNGGCIHELGLRRHLRRARALWHLVSVLISPKPVVATNYISELRILEWLASEPELVDVACIFRVCARLLLQKED
jgi:hypothetical protein